MESILNSIENAQSMSKSELIHIYIYIYLFIIIFLAFQKISDYKKNDKCDSFSYLLKNHKPILCINQFRSKLLSSAFSLDM